jgi:hypothetical protein
MPRRQFKLGAIFSYRLENQLKKLPSRVARFYLTHYTNIGGKYSKLTLNYQKAIKYNKRP